MGRSDHDGDERVLEGHAVVITGAGRGLGQAYAIHAAGAGAAVLINDVDAGPAHATAAAIQAAGGRAVVHVGSVSDWEHAGAAVSACLQRFGRIDGLINNAGIFIGGAVGTEAESDIRNLVEVNLLGSLFCGHHAAAAMIRQGSGSIINISSGASIGLPKSGTYGATKGGVLSATHCWALDLRAYGVRVNAVLPAAVTRLVGPESGEAPAEAVSPLVTYLLSKVSAGVTGHAFRIKRGRISLVTGPTDRLATKTAMPTTVAGVGTYIEQLARSGWSP